MTWPVTHWVLFCDDIRQEAGNKLSYMGVYDAEVQVPATAAPGPAGLQRLAIAAFLRWPKGEVPAHAVVQVRFSGSAVSEAVVGPPPANSPDWLTHEQHTIVFLLSPPPGVSDGRVEVSLHVGANERVLGELRVSPLTV